jgi:hypothetical protein
MDDASVIEPAAVSGLRATAPPWAMAALAIIGISKTEIQKLLM